MIQVTGLTDWLESFFMFFIWCFLIQSFNTKIIGNWAFNLFSTELSRFYDLDSGFDMLTWVVFFFLIVFFSISPFNIGLIEN